MTDLASDTVHNEQPEPVAGNNIAGFLQTYAHRQLTVVLTPRLMQLRRLVIGEVARFPEMAQVHYQPGPQRAVAALAQTFEHLAARGLLVMDDPMIAASHFNWLVMSEPLNRSRRLRPLPFYGLGSATWEEFTILVRGNASPSSFQWGLHGDGDALVICGVASDYTEICRVLKGGRVDAFVPTIFLLACRTRYRCVDSAARFRICRR